MTTTTPKTHTHIAHELLSRAHSPETATNLFTERIKQKPLFLRPTSPSAEDNRSRRRLHRLRKKEYFLRKQKPKPLSAREKRISGIYDIPKDECRYEVFKGLNGLWVEYMRTVLDLNMVYPPPVSRKGGSSSSGGGGGGPAGSDMNLNVKTVPRITPQSHGSRLVSADFHGALVEVVRSKCSGRVGIKGIVVRDTKFTFVVVTEGNELKTIPKEQTIFRFTIPLPTSNDETFKSGHDDKETELDSRGPGPGNTNPKELVFELHGNQFRNRPVDRTNKKFKWRNVDYL